MGQASGVPRVWLADLSSALLPAHGSALSKICSACLQMQPLKRISLGVGAGAFPPRMQSLGSHSCSPHPTAAPRMAPALERRRTGRKVRRPWFWSHLCQGLTFLGTASALL